MSRASTRIGNLFRAARQLGLGRERLAYRFGVLLCEFSDQLGMFDCQPDISFIYTLPLTV
jgi:hypothetical protein